MRQIPFANSQSRRPAHADGASHGGALMDASVASMGLYSGASNVSVQIGFEKGPDGKDRPAKGNGSARAELAARESQGDRKMRRSATSRHRTTVVHQTSVVPNNPQVIDAKSRWQKKAKEFASLVQPYSAEDLSEASGCTIEAAKLWKRAARFPSGTSLLTLGQSIPRIRDWIMDELETPPPPAPIEPAKLNAELGALIARLQIKALEPGEVGAQAKAMLAVLTGAD